MSSTRISSPSKLTEADKIAAKFHDGQTWEAEDGTELIDVCREASKSEDTNCDGDRLFVFADGSAIVTLDAFWDLAVEFDGGWALAEDPYVLLQGF